MFEDSTCEVFRCREYFEAYKRNRFAQYQLIIKYVIHFHKNCLRISHGG